MPVRPSRSYRTRSRENNHNVALRGGGFVYMSPHLTARREPGRTSPQTQRSQPMSTVDEIVSQKGNSVYTIGSEATSLAATIEMNRRQIGALVVTDAGKI